MPSAPSLFTKHDFILMALLALSCFLVVLFSTVRQENYHARSDSFGTLLTSQSIIQHGTIKLDAYGSFDALKAQYPYQLISHNHHAYYYFPIGTSLLAVPFVALANLCSKDMLNQSQDWAMQGWLAALTVCLLGILAYSLARFRLNSFPSALFASLFVLGTSLASTCGTAIWSFNGELVFMLIALHCLLALSDGHANRTMLSLLLGLSLFIAYLCRPTALIFVVGCMALLILTNRASAWRTLAVICACFLVFAAYSVFEYGTVVPSFYKLSRLSTTKTFSTALLGNLLSPSRGLLVFSPFFLVILVAGFFHLRRNSNLLILLFAYGWLLMQIIAVSRFPHWWGGALLWGTALDRHGARHSACWHSHGRPHARQTKGSVLGIAASHRNCFRGNTYRTGALQHGYTQVELLSQRRPESEIHL